MKIGKYDDIIFDAIFLLMKFNGNNTKKEGRLQRNVSSSSAYFKIS